MSEFETQVTDGFFMQIFDRTKGIDKFFETLFSFLRRKTDFYQDYNLGKTKITSLLEKE